MKNQRDKAILESLSQFKVLDRDQLVELHFSNLTDKNVACSRVMKRLERDGHVEPLKSHRPYWYLLKESKVKRDSQKLGHFRAIANFIIQVKKLGNLTHYEIEPKLGEKGTVEPDVFMIWNNVPFFVEVQCSLYSDKYMKYKFKRYEDYYKSKDWKKLSWQREDHKYFPYIWVVTDTKYRMADTNMKVFQTDSVETFLKKHMKK